MCWRWTSYANHNRGCAVRPCKCDDAIEGALLTPEQCVYCWLFKNSSLHRKSWSQSPESRHQTINDDEPSGNTDHESDGNNNRSLPDGRAKRAGHSQSDHAQAKSDVEPGEVGYDELSKRKIASVHESTPISSASIIRPSSQSATLNTCTHLGSEQRDSRGRAVVRLCGG